MPRTMRARPSRAMSAFGAAVGVVIFAVAAGSGAPPWFLLVMLGIVGVHVYNTVSARGIAESVFEIDDEPPPGGPRGRYCGACGAAAVAGDRYCRGCGAALGT